MSTGITTNWEHVEPFSMNGKLAEAIKQAKRVVAAGPISEHAALSDATETLASIDNAITSTSIRTHFEVDDYFELMHELITLSNELEARINAATVKTDPLDAMFAQMDAELASIDAILAEELPEVMASVEHDAASPVATSTISVDDGEHTEPPAETVAEEVIVTAAVTPTDPNAINNQYGVIPSKFRTFEQIKAAIDHIHHAARTGDLEHMNEHLQTLTDHYPDLYGNPDAADKVYQLTDSIREIIKEYKAHLNQQRRHLTLRHETLVANKFQLFARKHCPTWFIPKGLRSFFFGISEVTEVVNTEKATKIKQDLLTLKAHTLIAAEEYTSYYQAKHQHSEIPSFATTLMEVVQVDDPDRPEYERATIDHMLTELDALIPAKSVTIDPLTTTHCYKPPVTLATVATATEEATPTNVAQTDDEVMAELNDFSELDQIIAELQAEVAIGR